MIATMKTWLWNQATLKTLSIGNAAAYVIANGDRLTRFLGDARSPPDNDATERAIRGPVVGRRNHFGSKSQRGTEAAAVFYSLLETAKLCGVDPARYLREAALADARGEVLSPSRARRFRRRLAHALDVVRTGRRETLRSGCRRRSGNMPRPPGTSPATSHLVDVSITRSS